MRTLNTDYFTPPHGLGGASTIYPVSAFITDLVYMKETQIPVDVKLITVSFGESQIHITESLKISSIWVCDADKLKERVDLQLIQLASP